MTRRGHAARPAGGTDANGWTAEDRAAARTYRTQAYGGGVISKRYHEDMSDITNATPAPKAPVAQNDK